MGWMPDKSLNPSTIYSNHLMNAADPNSSGIGERVRERESKRERKNVREGERERERERERVCVRYTQMYVYT